MGEPDENLIALSTGVVKKVLGTYEAEFAADDSKKYIILNKLTLADFFMAITLISTAFIRYDYSTDFPHLSKYFKQIKTEYPIFAEIEEGYIESAKVLPE